MTHALPSHSSGGQRWLRGRPAWALSLIVIAGVAACDSPPLSPSEVPLAIDYEWPPAAEPLDNSTVSSRPAAVIIRWRPGEYSAADIQRIASAQCGMFHSTARATSPSVPADPLVSQRFACVAESDGQAPAR